jgi:hypothetical protein
MTVYETVYVIVAFKTLTRTSTLEWLKSKESYIIVCVLLVTFFVGLFIVRLPRIMEMLDLNGDSYSILSGLSLASWFLSFALLRKCLYERHLVCIAWAG